MNQHRPAILSTIERAVKAAAQSLLARKITMSEALAVVATAMSNPEDETATPRELAAAAHQGHRASVVAEIARLEQEGKGRAAPMILARSNAVDARDPVEVETLANKYRRWRRAEKRANARLRKARRVKKES